jgi:hypothetical protein
MNRKNDYFSYMTFFLDPHGGLIPCCGHDRS